MASIHESSKGAKKTVIDQLRPKREGFVSMADTKGASQKSRQSTVISEFKENQEKRFNSETEERRSYNSKINILDPDYTKETRQFLNGHILVRLEFKELEYAIKGKGNALSGLILPERMSVATKSGLREENVADPLPYADIGIIVNFDPNIKMHVDLPIEVGDFIQVNPNIALTQKRGDIHYLNNEYRLPGDTKFRGYVLISTRDILCKLNNHTVVSYEPDSSTDNNQEA